MMHQGEELTPEEEKKYIQVRNWVKAELARDGLPLDTIDVDAEFDKGISTSENYALMAEKMHKARAPAKAGPQYGSRNYVSEQDRKQEEYRFKEEAKEMLKEQGVEPDDVDLEKEYRYAKNPKEAKMYSGVEERIKAIKEKQFAEADSIERMESQNTQKEDKGIISNILMGVGEAKERYIDEPGRKNESRRMEETKSRAVKAIESIENRKTNLAVNQLEREDKALKKREFEESFIGRAIKSVKKSPEERYKQLREKRAMLQEERHIALLERQIGGSGRPSLGGATETPFWLKGANEPPGVMRQVQGTQRSALMDAATGRYQTRGYQGEYRQPKKKVITVNGRSYVVQQENQGYAPQAPQRTMLQEAMFGNHAQPYQPRGRREPEHVSPLMRASMEGHVASSHESPMAKALFSSPSATRGKEKPSPLQSAMFGGGSSKRSRFKL